MLISAGAFAKGGEPREVITFKFVPGEDMFYIPWEGNAAQLDALYRLVDEYRTDITSGAVPIYVDGYSASMKSMAKNKELAFVRANRVKSELIMHKGLVEDNFITKNYTTAYTDADGVIYKDMVVVTLRLPVVVSVEPRKQDPAPAPKPVPEPTPKTEPMPDTVVDVIPEPTTPAKPYCFAVRTNLLYDAFLLPTLGVEWRVGRGFGVKLDGSFAWWNGEKSKVQKMWIVNPEVRLYMGKAKRFYLGASGNFGEYNTYGYLLGKLYPQTTDYNGAKGDTGYQGKLWNAGLTVGYQLRLSRSFSLDFNLGLGYTNLEYDSYNIVDKVRVYNAKEQSKDFWGPTQAGLNLIWTIGGNK